MVIRLILILILLLVLEFNSFSQVDTSSSVVSKISIPIELDSVSFIKIDSISLDKKLTKLLDNYYSDGYLAASIESIHKSDTNFTVLIHKGNQFPYMNLSFVDTIQRLNSIDRKGYGIEGLYQLYEEQLFTLDSDGYPLSQIKPHNFKVLIDTLSFKVEIDTVSKIYFDTIVVNGITSLSYSFLSTYFNIKKGDVFSRKSLNNIPEKIKTLTYVELTSKPMLVFYGNKVKLVLNLKQLKNDVFDFLIGVLPQSGNESKKWNITGDLTLSLFNKIGFGEHTYLHYKKYKALSQEVELLVQIPYIKYFPVGFSSSLSIIKEEDDYLTIDSNIGIEYRKPSMSFTLDWIHHDSRLLVIDKKDSLEILSKLKLPDELDYVFNGISVGVKQIDLDHLTNPRVGYSSKLNIGVGNKNTLVNNNILRISNDEIDFTNSYDTLQLKTIQYEISGFYKRYFPVWNKSTILIGIDIAGKYDGKKLLKNEMYKIGGSNSLRGFDEEKIIVGMYSLLNFEYRLLLSNSSHLSFPFVDFAVTNNDFTSNNYKYYYGIGGGLNFDTKAGLFRFSVAVGQSEDIPFDFGRPKVHFGYLNVF